MPFLLTLLFWSTALLAGDEASVTGVKELLATPVGDKLVGTELPLDFNASAASRPSASEALHQFQGVFATNNQVLLLRIRSVRSTIAKSFSPWLSGSGPTDSEKEATSLIRLLDALAEKVSEGVDLSKASAGFAGVLREEEKREFQFYAPIRAQEVLWANLQKWESQYQHSTPLASQPRAIRTPTHRPLSQQNLRLLPVHGGSLPIVPNGTAVDSRTMRRSLGETNRYRHAHRR